VKWAYGNWKMAQTRKGLQLFISQWTFRSSTVEVGVFPSFVDIVEASEGIKSKALNLVLGGQDCSTEKAGAFTGEVSAESLKDKGATQIIIGHSERRQRGHETSESLKLKVERALEAGLRPVFCVGETESERDRGQTTSIVKSQLEVVAPYAKNCLLAYEPVWAIGTGKTPTNEDIAAVHSMIWTICPELQGVLYGGSVKPENAQSLGHIEGVSGFLVGGASLDPQSFKKIAEALV